jgi:hypothetical protein
MPTSDNSESLLCADMVLCILHGLIFQLLVILFNATIPHTHVLQASSY